jgi:hypothetical protein
MKNLLHDYLFWTYERGSVHYDIMVTLILLFLFVSPHFIDFKDRPVAEVPLHTSEVLVRPAVKEPALPRFVYEIRVEDLHGASTDAEIRAAILRIVEPISGDVTLQSYTPVLDAHHNVVAYDATVLR